MPSFILIDSAFPYDFPFVFGADQSVQVEDTPPTRAVERRYLMPYLFLDFSVATTVELDDPTNPLWHFNRDPVRPIEYRYQLPYMFMQLEILPAVQADDPENPVWHFNRDPVRPIEYRHLLPSSFFQGDPADFVVQEASDPENPVWHFNHNPVRPIEYRHLLPSSFFQGDPADFVVLETSDVESGWFQPTAQPVLQPPEVRHQWPNVFQWLSIVLVDQGILVTLPPRQLTATMRNRTLTTSLYPGDRKLVRR